MHFAVQTRPLVQSGLLTQALVCTLHLSAKHCGSTSSEVDLLFARSASSFSAHAGLPLTSSDPASAKVALTDVVLEGHLLHLLHGQRA